MAYLLRDYASHHPDAESVDESLFTSYTTKDVEQPVPILPTIPSTEVAPPVAVAAPEQETSPMKSTTAVHPHYLVAIACGTSVLITTACIVYVGMQYV